MKVLLPQMNASSTSLVSVRLSPEASTSPCHGIMFDIEAIITGTYNAKRVLIMLEFNIFIPSMTNILLQIEFLLIFILFQHSIQ